MIRVKLKQSLIKNTNKTLVEVRIDDVYNKSNLCVFRKGIFFKCNYLCTKYLLTKCIDMINELKSTGVVGKKENIVINLDNKDIHLILKKNWTYFINFLNEDTIIIPGIKTKNINPFLDKEQVIILKLKRDTIDEHNTNCRIIIKNKKLSNKIFDLKTKFTNPISNNFLLQTVMNNFNDLMSNGKLKKENKFIMKINDELYKDFIKIENFNNFISKNNIKIDCPLLNKKSSENQLKSIFNHNNLVFIDLEFNSDRGTSYSEIISIGAIKVDKNLRTIDTFYTTVKPTKSPKLTKWCKSFTGLSQSQIDNSPSFYDAMMLFDRWIDNNDCLIQWSNNDISAIKNDFINNNIKDFITYRKYYNIQEIFINLLELKNPISLTNALKIYNLIFSGTAHNALYDAINTFKLFLNFYNNLKIINLFKIRAIEHIIGNEIKTS